MSIQASTSISVAPHTEGATLLSDWGVIRATGEDAASFLHGQLTADILGLGEGQARLAGFCSAKGRLTASFVAWRAGADVLLACGADVLAATLKRLSMFVLRAKCKLSDASAEVPVWGVVGPAASGQAPWTVSMAHGGQLVHLPPALGLARGLWVGPSGQAPLVAALPANTWQVLEVASGVARVVAATVDQFVPQMVNFELVGGVNFKKGCYPGQEVVARSQYRGTLKRRAHLFEINGPALPGQEVFHSDDPQQPAGMVVLAAGSGNAPTVALVEVKLASLASGTLTLGSPEGSVLRWTPLPYELPSEAP
ncbi:MAG: folate-binding protein YgfZ [Ideonella sp. MAG2]|nr:MAG: folate-binding protein YgfZ [Ideonella sp. MAG2]